MEYIVIILCFSHENLRLIYICIYIFPIYSLHIPFFRNIQHSRRNKMREFFEKVVWNYLIHIYLTIRILIDLEFRNSLFTVKTRRVYLNRRNVRFPFVYTRSITLVLLSYFVCLLLDFQTLCLSRNSRPFFCYFFISTSINKVVLFLYNQFTLIDNCYEICLHVVYCKGVTITLQPLEMI